MKKEDFDKSLANGEVEIESDKPMLPPEILALLQKAPEDSQDPLADYASIIEALRKVKTFRTSAPTNVPKSFIDAIEFYDSGGTRRVYFYINKNWRYVALT